jgi:hypothetical protein
VEIRQAKLEDRPDFLRLWKEYLIDYSKAGSPIEVCDENIISFLGLFESYIAGSLFGFTLLAFEDDTPIGVLLMGENPSSGFTLRTNLGRMATLWGVYVQSDHRRGGHAWALLDQGRILSSRLGFDSMVSSVLPGDPANKDYVSSGGAKTVEHIVAFPLADVERSIKE